MANLITVCHKLLSKQQIQEIISVYNDRLQNDLTRDATLKAITRIALNQGASEIDLSNLNTLIPRLFDLLHKAQRSIHLNTLETLVAIVARYPQQFQN